jgi:hypothetical protein
MLGVGYLIVRWWGSLDVWRVEALRFVRVGHDLDVGLSSALWDCSRIDSSMFPELCSANEKGLRRDWKACSLR